MLADEFRSDDQGRRYTDVSELPGFDLIFSFFEDSMRQMRMIDSERHHLRPPLAGVVVELEKDSQIRAFYEALSPKKQVRVRQAVGVIVRLVMKHHHWTPVKDGEKTRGSLKGLSDWFNRSERYKQMEIEFPDF